MSICTKMWETYDSNYNDKQPIIPLFKICQKIKDKYMR